MKVKLATKLKNLNSPSSKQRKKKKARHYQEGASQEEIPIKDIIDGILITEDNRYVGIIEVFPIPYDIKSFIDKQRTIKSFTELFVSGPIKINIKVMSDTSNPVQLIRNIRKNCKNQNEPKIKKALNDYIAFINRIGQSGSVVRRFFIIYEYSKDAAGQNASDLDSILVSMKEMKAHIKGIMADCGNVCYSPDNENLFSAEIFYTICNRKTSRKESFEQRYFRMYNDFEVFNKKTNIGKEISYKDLFAPKGLYFTNKKYVFWDGYYYGFLGIDGDAWPEYVYWTWNQKIFDFGAYVDVDYIFKRLPHRLTLITLQQMANVTSGFAKELIRRGFMNFGEKSQRKTENNKYVSRRMEAGDQLWNAAIILTIRANSEKQLGSMKRAIKKQLQKSKIKTDSSRLYCEDYFRMTLPTLHITPVFSRLKHDILSSALRSMYPFISYQIYNPNGYVLGKNKDNHSMAVIDNFNTELYENANMLLLGTSGAGKTYTQQIIARRMFLNGIRCFFIIPKKGYEYKNGCTALNGTFISLRPGSSDCVNIMEIRPEGEINKKMVSDDAVIQNSSLLAKKVTSLIVWLQLLFKDTENATMTTREFNILNRLIIKIYNDYGITEDNQSIFQENSNRLKPMPILGDLYEAMQDEPEVNRICDVIEPFVTGACKNMNGQTNVNLRNNYIVFDIDEDDIGEKLFASFLYIGFDFVYSIVKENVYSKDAIFLDEVWKLMADKDSAKQVKNMIKLVRGYGGSAILATQELQDFLKVDDEFGKSVLNNTALTILLKLKEMDLKLVKESLRLSEEDCDTISKLKKGTQTRPGECMLIANGDKIVIEVSSTKEEFEAFNTDINARVASW